MNLYIAFLLALFIVAVHLAKWYTGHLIAFVLKRLLRCRYVFIENISLRAVGTVKLVLFEGLSIELREICLKRIFNWSNGGGPSLDFCATVQQLRIGQQHGDGELCAADQGRQKNFVEIEEHGRVEEFSLSMRTTPDGFQLNLLFQKPLEFIWSPTFHLICLETIRKAHLKISSFSNIFKSFYPTSIESTPSKTFLFDIQSEHSMELSFKLPKEHNIRLIVPSFTIIREALFMTKVNAPNLLVEMDGNIIMNVESPSLECVKEDLVMNVIRGEFKSLELACNRLWSWSADTFQIVFPYGYCFADAFEEAVNCIKWVKVVHRIDRKPFTLDSPLPADVRIRIQSVSLRIEDDPFEIHLQNIYEVQMDEVFERERRKRILDEKVAQFKKGDPFFPSNKIDELYRSLVKKDEQLYIERIRKVHQQQQDRCLFHWVINDLELRAFADPSLHGKANVLDLIHRFNPESNFPNNEPEFSTLWARAVEMDMADSRMNFRDYPLPYFYLKKAHLWGILVGAEQLMETRSVRQSFVHTPFPWGTFVIDRNMCPLKFFYDLKCDISELNLTYGPCWEPCLTMISQCWSLVNPPSKDPSDPLPFWDKVRLLLHGKFAMACIRLQTSMLGSTDPYNDTELVEIVWEDFEFDWLTGEFWIRADVDAFMRTASKYDDSRLLHLPRLDCNIRLNWICLGDQHDHHSVQPCAPDKLPEYSTNVGHDSYRAFRSACVNPVISFKTNSWDELRANNHCPQIQLYANTFKCLDILMKTLLTVNRPIKRGPIFKASKTKRFQLSRHFRNVQFTATLPRFFISYWMSFSSSYGFRLVSENLQLLCSAQLQIHPSHSNDGISRRAKIAWKMLHTTACFGDAQIHLYGENRNPVGEEDNISGDSNENNNSSFFIGLSRLIYIRESRQNKNVSLIGHVEAEDFMSSSSSGNSGATETAVHRLTITDLKASWTINNRDICLVIAEGVQKAHILRKILNNEALKMFKLGETPISSSAYCATGIGHANINGTAQRLKNSSTKKNCSNTGLAVGSPRRQNGTHRPSVSSAGNMNDERDMLWRLVDEAETNLVAYSEEIVQNPTESLNGVALCNMDDVILTNWQIDLLNSQLVLKSSEKVGGFILVTAARASVTQRLHVPVWRHTQLLLKTSWSAVLSGMQYFAPVFIALESDGTKLKPTEFHWLNRDVIEEKLMPSEQGNSKMEDFSTTGEAVGGVVVENSTISMDSNTPLQLQRVASRCSCQLFFCYFSDLLDPDELEKMAIAIPTTIAPTGRASLGEQRSEEVDTLTLKHNILEVCTNSEQYQMCIDILQNLILFVDPRKTQTEGNRRRMWFELLKKPKQSVRGSIQKMQNDLRELVSLIRALERQSFHLNKEIQIKPDVPQLNAENKQLQTEIDEYKQRQNVLIDELAMMISCYKEKEVEEQVEQLKIELRRQYQERGEEAEGDEDEQKSFIARRFEVCFENCTWRLTEMDGQISLSEVQIRNFLYTRTARIDNSGDHLLEIGVVKVLNLLPDSKYKETLARLQVANSNVSPSIRVICRELPPVGGIGIKEHFEVNIAPMHAQITYRFFEKMMQYFFPGRNIDKEDQQNLDTSDEQNQQNQQNISLARRIRGAVNHSFRSGKSKTTHYAAIRDEIDKMRERSEKNNMFVYIIIPAVPFLVSYKGSKEKNLEDVDRFNLTFPICEYHDKSWTWLDLALAIKQRCKRVLLQQFINQKFLRNNRVAIDRMAFEPVDDEEKRRILLGNTANMLLDKKQRKRKK